jgi:hypothetical protein
MIAPSSSLIVIVMKPPGWHGATPAFAHAESTRNARPITITSGRPAAAVQIY